MNRNTVLIAIVVTVLVLAGGYWWYTTNGTSDSTVETGDTSTNTGGTGTQQSGGNRNGSGSGSQSNTQDEPLPEAAAAARTDLSVKLDVAEEAIVINDVLATTWSDSCLGLGKANESCAQVLTPGFRVEMVAQGKTYIYRTDKTGAMMRAEAEVI